jgi:hypothetical protein
MYKNWASYKVAQFLQTAKVCPVWRAACRSSCQPGPSMGGPESFQAGTGFLPDLVFHQG